MKTSLIQTPDLLVSDAQKKGETFKNMIEPKSHSASTIFHFNMKRFPIRFVSPTEWLLKNQSSQETSAV